MNKFFAFQRLSTLACRCGRWLLCALALAGAMPPAAAQGTSDKPLRMILPMAAGSVGDTLARHLAVHLARTLARPVIVDDLPGGGGMTGTAQLVRAPRDGLTLALISSSHVINPFIYKSMPFDALKDITPITVLGTAPFVLAVHPSLPVQNVAELVALLKANPNKYTYGSAGNGSVTQLAMALFGKETGTSVRHIPYKGLAAQVNDMLGGQVELGFIPIGVAAPLVNAGKLRALGVSSATRTLSLPNVPTIAEQGVSSYLFTPWLAIVGPAGLPAAQVEELYVATRAALAQKDVRDFLDAQDFTVVSSTPEQTAAFMQAELKRLGLLVKYAGATAE